MQWGQAGMDRTLDRICREVLVLPEHRNYVRAGRKLLCGGGGGWHGSPFAQPPPLPLLGRRAGRGVWAGAALPAVPGGGGGPTPTYMAQNDPHVALIVLTTHLWGEIFS